MLDVDHLTFGADARREAARHSDWLPRLYDQRQAILRDDLSRSWNIMQIFVPLALAPFAAVVLVDGLSLAHIALLGGASCLVLLFAILHVERMDAHANWSWSFCEQLSSTR